MVACLFAGVGAWATKVDVAPSYTYASELFGAGHGAIKYGEAGNPVVTLTIPGDSTGVDTDDADTDNVDERITMMGRMHNGEADITFTLQAGVFDANVSGLMWDPDGPPRNDPDQTVASELAVVCDTGGGTDLGCEDPRAAPGTVASIIDGGRKGDNSITIKIEAATAGGGGDATAFDTDLTDDNGGRNADYTQLITFELPALDELTALAGATADKPKTVGLLASSRIVSGSFTDGLLTKKTVKGQEAPDPRLVLTGVNAVSVSISDDNEHAIAIDDNEKTEQEAFLHLKGANKAGFVKLADVTIETATERPISDKVEAATAKAMYSIRTGATTEVADDADDSSFVYSLPSPGKDAVAHEILDLDGVEIDAGLRGTLTITAEGSRSLFNDDDVMFVDYDGDGEMGGSEGIELDGNMAEGTALSIDPDDTDSFEGGTGTFSVYYMAGGKGAPQPRRDDRRHRLGRLQRSVRQRREGGHVHDDPQLRRRRQSGDGVCDSALDQRHRRQGQRPRSLRGRACGDGRGRRGHVPRVCRVLGRHGQPRLRRGSHDCGEQRDGRERRRGRGDHRS